MDQSHSNIYANSRKHGKHLSLDERDIIQALHHQGMSLRSIAVEVGCAHTTVMYELRRGYTTAQRPSRPNSHIRGETRVECLQQTPQTLPQAIQTGQ